MMLLMMRMRISDFHLTRTTLTYPWKLHCSIRWVRLCRTVGSFQTLTITITHKHTILVCAKKEGQNITYPTPRCHTTTGDSMCTRVTHSSVCPVCLYNCVYVCPNTHQYVELLIGKPPPLGVTPTHMLGAAASKCNTADNQRK